MSKQNIGDFVMVPRIALNRLFHTAVKIPEKAEESVVPTIVLEELEMRSAAPQPGSGDARELAQKIKTSCLIDGYFLVGDATDLITSFGARIRAETIEQCAKICDDMGGKEQENHGLGREAQNYYRACNAIRALVSRT